MNAESPMPRPGSVTGAKAELEAALLDAIWHAWFYGDRDSTAALATTLRTARANPN